MILVLNLQLKTANINDKLCPYLENTLLSLLSLTLIMKPLSFIFSVLNIKLHRSFSTVNTFSLHFLHFQFIIHVNLSSMKLSFTPF